MAYLLDTNILLRLVNPSDVQHPEAKRAVILLRRHKESLYVTPQCLIEFRNSATRPLNVNGFGYAITDAEAFIAQFEADYEMLEDTPDIYPAWKALVSAAGVIGKQVHDARLAAVCQVHGVGHVLTFNVRDFARFEPHLPGFAAVAPASG